MSAAAVLYIAGDVHLQGGESADCSFHQFLDNLAQRPAARLVLLGDLFEYWLETASATTRYAQTLTRLRALRHAGWHLDLVLGNRELAGGRVLETSTGCAMHWPQLDVEVGPVHVRIVHGDRLCHDPRYHFFSAWIRSFWHRTWQILHPALIQDAVARVLRTRSKSKQLRRQVKTHQAISKSVFIDARRVRAAARGVDTVIAGHIHESWRRSVGGVDLILVGDWPAQVGHWVEGFADGRLERVQKTF